MAHDTPNGGLVHPHWNGRWMRIGFLVCALVILAGCDGGGGGDEDEQQTTAEDAVWNQSNWDEANWQ